MEVTQRLSLKVLAPGAERFRISTPVVDGKLLDTWMEGLPTTTFRRTTLPLVPGLTRIPFVFPTIQKSKSAVVQGLVDKLFDEIDFLQGLAMGSVSRREKLDSLRATTALVPETKVLERVIRYEAHLERTLDRALSQLERLQRMRLGQPVLPPLRVEVSK